MDRSIKIPKPTRISDLPDDVLLSCILSKLTLKDLVKTTVLSKRWLSLALDQWASRKDLNLDLHNMFGSNERKEFNCFPNTPGLSYKFKTEDLESFDRVRSEFVRRVNPFMQHSQGAKIDSLRLDFLLCYKQNNIIDRWIGSAIDKGVGKIELLFSNRTYFFPGQKPYKFPHRLSSESDSSCMEYLHLQNCLLMPPAEFSGFKNLRTLVLDQLVVTEDLLSCLFSKCFHLEDLTFILCDFNSDLNIVSPTLRHLKLINCGFPLSRKIDIVIVTVQLSSFEYSGNILMISSINAPQLSKFYLNPTGKESEVPYAFDQIASFHQLENLTMHLCHSQTARLPSSFGPFQRLKKLELFILGPEEENEDCLWVLNFVMASPHLQELSLAILVPELFTNQRQRREHPGFSHNELKYVELCGCVGNMHEIELASHFLKNVNSLQQISFSPCCRYYIGAGRWYDGFDNPHWFQRGRNLIREMLQDEGNERTRFIFL